MSFYFFPGLQKECFKRPLEWKEFLSQCYKIGTKSLTLVLITAFLLGLVLAIQTPLSLISFGAKSLLPGTVSVSDIKEIGPVKTAII